MFPNPQGANSSKVSWQSPMVTKAFPATSKEFNNTNPMAAAKGPPDPAHKSPIKVSSSPKAGGWWVFTQRNKDNAITCTGMWKDCLHNLQRVKRFFAYQTVPRQSSTSLVLQQPSRLPHLSIIPGATLHLYFWLQLNYRLCFPVTISSTLCGCATLIKGTGKARGRVLQALDYM